MDGAQRVVEGSCKVLAMHLDVYAGVTMKTKTCPVGHLKPVCIVVMSSVLETHCSSMFQNFANCLHKIKIYFFLFWKLKITAYKY